MHARRLAPVGAALLLVVLAALPAAAGGDDDVAALRAQVEALRDSVVRLQSRLAEIEADLASARDDLAAGRRDADARRAERARLEARLADAEARALARVEEAGDAVDARIRDLQAALREETAARRAAREDAEALGARLETEREAAALEVRDLRERIEELHERIEAGRLEFEALRDRARRAEAEAARARLVLDIGRRVRAAAGAPLDPSTLPDWLAPATTPLAPGWQRRAAAALATPIDVTFDEQELVGALGCLADGLGVDLVVLPGLRAELEGTELVLQLTDVPAATVVDLLVGPAGGAPALRWESVLLGRSDELAALPDPSLRTDGPRDEATFARLEALRTGARLEDDPLLDALAWFRARTGADVWVSRVAAEAAGRRNVTLRLTDVGGLSLLAHLTAPYGMAARLLDGVVLVEEAEEALAGWGPGADGWGDLAAVRVDLEPGAETVMDAIEALAASSERTLRVDPEILDRVEGTPLEPAAALHDVALPLALELLRRRLPGTLAWRVEEDAAVLVPVP